MQTRSGRTMNSDSNDGYQECNSQPFNPVFPEEKDCIKNTYDKYNDMTDVMNRYQCCNYFSTIIKFTFVVCFLSVLHWTLVTLYISWCYKPGVWGAVTNIFTVGSPICLALNRIQSLISDHFIGLFVSSIIGFNTALQTLFRF